jgi:hypothetical protein
MERAVGTLAFAMRDSRENDDRDESRNTDHSNEDLSKLMKDRLCPG